MRHSFFASALVGLTLAASGAVAQSASPAWLSIVGKTLVNGKTEVTLKRNGSLVGTGIKGAWQERNGKYCRTLTKPKKFAGTECQVVSLNGDQVTFDNQNGRTSTWTIK